MIHSKLSLAVEVDDAGAAWLLDVEERYMRLSEAGDALERLNAVVPWEVFRKPLAKALKRSDGAKGGRPPYDPVLMFKILVVLEPRRPGPLDQDMPYLIWRIAERTDYSAQVPLPRLRFLPREEINRRHYSLTEGGYRGQRDIVAFYHDARNRITLPSTFDIRRDQGTLVHELLHHLQNVHGRQFRCPAEREREAYLIQARFVAETGIGTMPSRNFIASLRC